MMGFEGHLPKTHLFSGSNVDMSFICLTASRNSPKAQSLFMSLVPSLRMVHDGHLPKTHLFSGRTVRMG